MSSIRKISLKVLGSIIVLVLLIIFAISPSVEKISTLAENYKDTKKTILEIEKKELSLDEQERFFEKTQPTLSITDKAFLAKKDLVGFLSTLENLALKNKNKIEILSVSEPEENKPYFTFIVLLKGNFPDSLRFLFALENIPESPYRLLEIKKLEIKRITVSGEEKEKGKIEGNFEIRVYSKI